MGEKRYQISPIELVRWAEPLFGRDQEEAGGFPEEWLASYEAKAGIRLPAALREYLLTCGRASLNQGDHPMLVPDRDAKPFDDYLTFSYAYIRDDLEWMEKEGGTGDEVLEQLRALPEAQWGTVAGNCLLFWRENQACWYAGIRVEDLDQPDPPVYYNDEDDMYHWASFSDSVSSFLLAMVLDSLPGDETDDPEAIRSILDRAGVDFQRLKAPYPFKGGRFAHTCLDAGSDTLFVYGEQSENRAERLMVVRA